MTTATGPDTVEVRTGAGPSYEVVIGSGVSDRLPGLVGEAARVAVLHDERLDPTTVVDAAGDAGARVTAVPLPSGEQAKTASVLARCWDALGDAGLTRSDLIVSYGGGATTDLAGFAAASWLRGIACVHVPTSLLGMVDAAVGGKTGIDTPAGKNLVGAFWEPSGVLCDTDALRTLPQREYVSGLAEVIKCGFIADPAILDLVEQDLVAASSPDGPATAELIRRAVEVKAAAISGDLRERTGSGGDVGREALNYGHTLGHAIERTEAYSWRHGDAVAVGMVFVAELAHRSGLIDDALLARHRSVLAGVGLPTSYAAAPFDELVGAMRLDKKSRGDTLRFVVLGGLGTVQILAGPDESVLRGCYAALA